MNEAETRAEHIAPALKAAGRCVVEGSRILREEVPDGGKAAPRKAAGVRPRQSSGSDAVLRT